MTARNWLNACMIYFLLGFTPWSMGWGSPEKIAILTGSGQSAVDKILDCGADTLITGELKQHHFNLAQELELNLYTCGHYATECFGVDALAKEISQKFDLPYEFVETNCPSRKDTRLRSQSI